MPKNPTPTISIDGTDDHSLAPKEPVFVVESPVAVAGDAATPALVHLGATATPDPAPVVALEPESIDDGCKTPAQWAEALGHVDGPARFADGEKGAVERKATRSIREAKGWIFAAVKRHAGWGAQHPEDVRLTRDEYEAAVTEALGTTFGPPAERKPVKGEPEMPVEGLPRPLAWRADVVARAAAEATSEAAKAGGER